MHRFILAAGLSFAAAAAAAQTPVLTVYAPDYFTSEWGPGPAIETAFEAECGCDLQYVPGDLLPRLLLEGERTRADVVIGLSTDISARARETGLFAPHGQDTGQLTMPVEWQDDVFLPFDWSYVSFMYDTTKVDTPPASFEDLRNGPEDQKIVLQDPRSAVSGLALALWVKAVYGDQTDAFWADLAPRILTVTAGWSEAYGLFTDGEAPIVLSFNTSAAYHQMAEGDETKKAAIFDEGHYLYVELAGKVAGTGQPELADQFMAFILSEPFQSVIPETNWSYPAALADEKLPEGFRTLPAPDKAFYYGEAEAEALRAEAIAEWQRGLSR